MRSYLFAHIAALVEGPKNHFWAFAILAAIWSQLQSRYEGFLASTPLFVMFVLWTSDFLLGSMIALRNSYRVLRGRATVEEKAGRWSPSRVAWAVARFCAWFILFAATYAVRQAGERAGYIALVLEAAVALHEGSSLMRNYGIFTGATWAPAFAKVAEDAAQRLPEVAQMTLEELLPEPGPNGKYDGPHS